MVLEIEPSYSHLRTKLLPWSADENRDFLLSYIGPDDRVLDVGAGAGIWADLLGERGYRRIRRHAVEIFEPYISRFGLQEKYGKIHIGDFRELALPHNVYNILILGDVLEHFVYEEAMTVWEKARQIVGPEGLVLLSTPIIDFPQGEEEGNIHEAHLSSFDMEALRSLSGVSDSQEGTIIGSVVARGSEAPSAADLTVLVTTIPTRQDRLTVALTSIETQTLKPGTVHVQTDIYKEGAPVNRDRGIEEVKTKYVALLDDDDYFYPDHLEALYTTAIDTDADIVYSWFDVDGGTDPFPENFGQPWNPDKPIQTTVTILAKTDVIRKAGGYSSTAGMSDDEIAQFAQGNTIGEDFRLVCNANKMGAKIVHVPKKTWSYVHHSSNTSGRTDRW
jgi:SAM-dependent methyltransferase